MLWNTSTVDISVNVERHILSTFFIQHFVSFSSWEGGIFIRNYSTKDVIDQRRNHQLNTLLSTDTIRLRLIGLFQRKNQRITKWSFVRLDIVFLHSFCCITNKAQSPTWPSLFKQGLLWLFAFMFRSNEVDLSKRTGSLCHCAQFPSAISVRVVRRYRATTRETV